LPVDYGIFQQSVANAGVRTFQFDDISVTVPAFADRHIIGPRASCALVIMSAQDARSNDERRDGSSGARERNSRR
jgi:hypothetical protein